MVKRSNAYWEKRSIERLTRAEKTSVKYLKEVQKLYRSSARSVVRTVKDTYASYYRDDKTFSQDALEEIEPRGNITKFLNDMKQSGLKISLPENFKGRMSRLRMLEAQLWGESKKIALKEKELSDKAYKNTLTDTYYRTIFDISKGTGKTPAFTTLNKGTIDAILNTKFEGSNYSERIWGNTDKLASSLKDILARAVATGQSQEKTVNEVMERFNVGFHNANRLIRTETNYFENKAELESYKELGIKKFRFVATLDERTSDICRAMDGKEFSVKEADQGENAPPLHPYCRSTIVPIVEGWEPEERAARNPEGEVEIVKNMNYEKWRKKIYDVEKVALKPVIIDRKTDILAQATPGIGSVERMKNWPENQELGREEEKVANWLKNTLGGNVRYVPRSETPTPDYKWDKSNLELKTFTTKNLNQVSKQVYKASKQISGKGGAILDFTNSDLWKDKRSLFKRIRDDMLRNDIDFVIVKYKNKLEKYYAKEKKRP